MNDKEVVFPFRPLAVLARGLRLRYKPAGRKFSSALRSYGEMMDQET
jgi:hypothetical protein